MSGKIRYLKIKTLNSYEYFCTDTGGCSRKWVKRYKDMLKEYEYICRAPKDKTSQEYIEGFKACIDIFHERDNILKTIEEYQNER